MLEVAAGEVKKVAVVQDSTLRWRLRAPQCLALVLEFLEVQRHAFLLQHQRQLIDAVDICFDPLQALAGETSFLMSLSGSLPLVIDDFFVRDGLGEGRGSLGKCPWPLPLQTAYPRQQPASLG